MALVVKDRVRETSVTQGTGTFTLDGAVTGYQSFSAIGNGNTTYYTIYLQASNEWEVGIGTYTASGTTLSRDTILASSNGGSVVNFSAGTKDVFVTYPAGRSVYYDTATNVTVNQLSATTVDATNVEVTNIKAKDGTAALSIADSTGVVSVSANPVLSGGTANGVLYLNASKVATSGTALVFDGTNLGLGGTPTATGGYANLNINGSSGGQILFGTANSYQQTIYNTSTSLNYYASNASNHIWSISAAERMRLNSTSLNIGGNFTSTNNTLQVTGNAAIGDTLAGPTDGLYVKGNVGIGTNSPQGPLEVAATGATVNQFLTGGTGNNAVTGIFRIGSGLGRGASIQGFRGASSNIHSLDFYSYNAADVFGMRLNASGNLGIGETNPTYKLEVNGGASDAMSLFNSTNANGAHLRFAASGTVKSYIGGAPGFLGSGTADDLGIRAVGSILFATAGSGVDMTLDSSGNLGLGVTPSGWRTGFSTRAIQVGLVGSLSSLQASTTNNQTFVSSNTFLGASDWVYLYSDAASQYRQYAGQHNWFTAPSGTANTTTITNGVSYTIITSGNQTAFGAANNNVGTQFTATSSGTLSSGTVSQNISFTQAMTLDASGNLGIGQTNPSTWLVNGLGIGSGANDWGATIYTGTASTGYLCFADGATGLDRYRGYISYAHATNAMIFATDAAERARITSTGMRVGLFNGVGNSTWYGYSAVTNDLGGSTGNVGLYLDAPYNAGTTNTGFFRTKRGAGDTYNGTEIGVTSVFRILTSTTEDTNERVRVGNSEMVVNEPGNDYDFRVESDTDTHCLFVDASTDRVGIGTNAPGYKVDIANASSFTGLRLIRTNNSSQLTLTIQSATAIIESTGTGSNALAFNTEGTERARITSGGNFGIGGISPVPYGANNRVLQIDGGANASEIRLTNNTTGTAATNGGLFQMSGNDLYIWNVENSFMSLGTNNGEKARITSGGYFKASNNGTYASSAGALHELKGDPDDNVLRVENYQATLTNAIAGVRVIYTAASPNTTDRSFLYCNDSTALRADIRSNGGLANYQANDVNLSDQRTKKDIVAAPSYWDKIKNIEIVHFKYKDQTHDDNNVGVIAQQVEQVAPEFVDQDGWGETPEDGVPLKSIYTSDMYHAAIKALQEAMARIEKLEAEMAALKGA